MAGNYLKNTEEEVEIDLMELFQFLKTKLKFIVVVTVLFAIVSGLVTTFVMEEKYMSTARVFPKPEVNEGIINSSQLNSEKTMVNNYVALLQGSNIQSQVADELNLKVEDISNSVSVSNETNTQFITICAETVDPQLSKRIVDTMVEVFTKELEEKLEITNIMVVDEAKVPKNPSSPSFIKNVVIAAVAGIGVSCGYFLVVFLLDTRIHNKEDAEKFLGIPSLGVVPHFQE